MTESSTEMLRPKQFLFVDDDGAFLATLRDLFGKLSKGVWEIHLAQNHAQAFAELQKRKMDVIVVDIGMPIVDGVQFLRLLNRTHPGQQVVVLTGIGTEAQRKECLELGALLFLQKPTAPGGFESIFAALNAVATTQLSEGFRGMMRRVGLQEVIQMECLGAKSSLLEIFTGNARGRIYIEDGVIIHAEKDTVQGEVALYSLLALRGGEFNLRPFEEPARRTIQGQWEFLLMEAARLTDEAAQQPEESAQPETDPESESPTEPTPDKPAAKKRKPAHPTELRVEEVVLCSGAGEVLYDWQCKSLERRVAVLTQVEQQARALSNFTPLGRLESVEIITAEERIICQILPDRRLFVRSTGGAL